MTPEIVNSIIDNLAIKLAVPANHLFNLIPQLGYLRLYSFLVAVGTFILLLLLGSFSYIRATKLKNENKDCDIYGIIFTLSFIINIFLFAIICAMLPNIIFWIRHPEAWSMNYLITLLH